MKANAQLEAALKKKKTLDLAAILKADLASQKIMARENMQELVNLIVDLQMDHQNKKSKKAILEAAQTKSLGGASTAKTPPGKQNNGDILKGKWRKVAFVG